MNQTLELMKEHVSVRSYLDKPIALDLLKSILATAQSAATSSHIQAYSVIRVTDTDKRQTLSEAAGGQKWVVEAPEFLVFCADLLRLDTASQKSDLGPMEGGFEHSLASIVDVALYAQNVLLAAESEGLGGVFIGGIRNNPQTVIDVLELPEMVFPVFGMCLGWPNNKNKVKPRLPLESILHTNTYSADAISENVESFDETMSNYYDKREDGSTRNWSKTVANALQKKKREHMKQVLNEQRFFTQ